MENQLEIRKGPELNFIIDEFKLPFETKVLNAYAKSSISSEYLLPHAHDDLLDYAMNKEPEHFVASYLAANGDDDFFITTMNFDKEEVKDFCNVILDALNSPLRQESYELLYFDVVAVLEYNRMSFAELDFTINGNQGDYLFRNLPFNQVW